MLNPLTMFSRSTLLMGHDLKAQALWILQTAFELSQSSQPGCLLLRTAVRHHAVQSCVVDPYEVIPPIYNPGSILPCSPEEREAVRRFWCDESVFMANLVQEHGELLDRMGTFRRTLRRAGIVLRGALMELVAERDVERTSRTSLHYAPPEEVLRTYEAAALGLRPSGVKFSVTQDEMHLLEWLIPLVWAHDREVIGVAYPVDATAGYSACWAHNSYAGNVCLALPREQSGVTAPGPHPVQPHITLVASNTATVPNRPMHILTVLTCARRAAGWPEDGTWGLAPAPQARARNPVPVEERDE